MVMFSKGLRKSNIIRTGKCRGCENAEVISSFDKERKKSFNKMRASKTEYNTFKSYF